MGQSVTVRDIERMTELARSYWYGGAWNTAKLVNGTLSPQQIELIQMYGNHGIALLRYAAVGIAIRNMMEGER